MGHMNECIRVHQRLYDGELGLFNSRREGWRSKGEQVEPLQIASAIPTPFLSRSVATLPRAPASSQEPWSAFQILQFQLETAIIARKKLTQVIMAAITLNLECCLPILTSRSGLGQVVGQELQSEISFLDTHISPFVTNTKHPQPVLVSQNKLSVLSLWPGGHFSLDLIQDLIRYQIWSPIQHPIQGVIWYPIRHKILALLDYSDSLKVFAQGYGMFEVENQMHYKSVRKTSRKKYKFHLLMKLIMISLKLGFYQLYMQFLQVIGR